MEKTVIFCVLLGTFLAGSLLLSQTTPASKPPEFNHIAIYVRDLEKSAAFYEKVMGLEKIPSPFKDTEIVWFRIGAHDQLHVIGGAKDSARTGIEVHNAFRVVSIPDFMARLDKAGVKYRSFKGDAKVATRPDGVSQIYLQDPDGYWIEVNDDKY